MKKTIIEWRKATDDELQNGSAEMVIENQHDVDVPIPDREVELWKIKDVINEMGLDSAINLAFDSLPEPTRRRAKTAWEYGTVIKQNSPTVLFITSAINKTNEEVNEIFNQAESINL